ncbi:MAG: DNA repair ATPase [Acidobacteriota bacterium]
MTDDPNLARDGAAEEASAQGAAPGDGDAALERGTYELLRERLEGAAAVLRQQAQQLNSARLETFGSSELTLAGQSRIRTEHNCRPRDIATVGERLIVGYEVHFGLRRETSVGHVFSVHRFGAEEGADAPPHLEPARPGDDGFLQDERFARDFEELFRYYKDTRLLQLRNVGDRLLGVFQVGTRLSDLKVFRWSLDPEGGVSYIDNRGERDHTFAAAYDFEWQEVSRDSVVPGRHPHLSIEDELFVETIGGDLTIKVENNTEDGLGIYQEPVIDPDQSLDDAELRYARVGSLILLSVLPYREPQARYFVYNTRNRTVHRIDAIGQSCRQLPEDHGLIFPGGYYLTATDSPKTFDLRLDGLELKTSVRSPNGEDVLYIFHQRSEGRSVLLPYNLIRKAVATPIECFGFTIFDDGTLVVFRAISDEPSRVHPLQIWRTPFAKAEFFESPSDGSPLQRLGNAELVRGISDALSLAQRVMEQEPSRRVYEDLIAAARRMEDAYHWLGDEAYGGLGEAVAELVVLAEQVVDEFEKVEALRARAHDEVNTAEAELDELLSGLAPSSIDRVEPFLEALAQLRRARGHLITLRDLRYADLDRLEALEQRAQGAFDEVSEHAVAFFAEPKALEPFRRTLGELESSVEAVSSLREIDPLAQRVDEQAQGLELLAQVTSGLESDDATVRTRILEGVSEVLGQLNRVRAIVDARRREVGAREARAEFGVQFQLLGQSAAGALAVASTPEACDEQLAKVLLQLEDLEARFGAYDDFLEQITTKRDDLYEAFASRKQRLLDERQRRVEHLFGAAQRVLEGMERRAESFDDDDDLNAFFASDPLAERLRRLGGQLRELGAGVRADELESRVKSARQQARRGMRDRRDLFTAEGDLITFGAHRFTVNQQALEPTLVPRGDDLVLHLTSTEYYEALEDERVQAAHQLWEQSLPSESEEVYRGEFLAYSVWADSSLPDDQRPSGFPSRRELESAVAEGVEGLTAILQPLAAQRYEEGYERGLHDVDGARILESLLQLDATAGLLRFEPQPRALAALFWAGAEEDDRGHRELRREIRDRAQALHRLRSTYGGGQAVEGFLAELSQALRAFCAEQELLWGADESANLEDAPPEIPSGHPSGASGVPGALLQEAAAYLFEVLAVSPQRFPMESAAQELVEAAEPRLKRAGALEDLRRGPLGRRVQIAEAWLSGVARELEAEAPERQGGIHLALAPATALLLAADRFDVEISHGALSARVEGLLGRHGRIEERTLALRLDRFLSRLREFRQQRVPAFQRWQRVRHEVLEEQRRRLRLDSMTPKVMSAFVRNQLVDQVYLPLVGANLAKQMGSAGAQRRTDQMGLLLLLSPPGYGKTTLMEYVAHRLGLAFLKIDGPALGHDVHSLDPAQAPSATARREVEKINLAFEMGNNVLLYLDDIQHTHPELLQKFISLCDAQRRIEGVFRGEPRSYDLRGKRFAVVMAGNPYTESGETFRIPDMLSNRADVYNLGDVLNGKEDLFALSYLENALTSNATLSPLASRDLADVGLYVRLAKGETVPPDRFAHAVTGAERADLLAVLRHLLRVQSVLMAVNQAYIRSAAQVDAYRSEPPFLLQGSYRNMNKVAERVVPVMNEAELEALIDDHYLGEAQTLTTGAEHNLLKLAFLRGRETEEQKERWDAICRAYARVQASGGDADPASRVVGQLSLLTEGVAQVGQTLASAAQGETAPSETSSPWTPELVRSAATELSAHWSQQLSRHLGAQLGEHLGDPLGERLAPVLNRLSEQLEQDRSPTPVPPPLPAAARIDSEALASALRGPIEELGAQFAEVAKALSESSRPAVVQSLSGSVRNLLDDLVRTVEDSLLPAVRRLNRRVEDAEDAEGRHLSSQIDRALTDLDRLKDFAATLRSLDASSSKPPQADLS